MKTVFQARRSADVSVVATNDASINPVIRAIVDADYKIDKNSDLIHFSLKSHKVFLFDKESEERINFEVK